MSKEKRYVATIEMYVYAENDYMAKKRANDLKLSIEIDAIQIKLK